MATVNHSDHPRNGTHPTSNPDLDAFEMADFSEELKRLSDVNRELLGGFGDAAAGGDGEEGALLRLENADLRAKVEELEQLLQHAAPADGEWADRQREYEALLEEKSEVIRALHLKIQQIQEAPAAPAGPDLGPAPDADGLHRLKAELDEERARLQEDEEAMMRQMREMEMAMARDRAELARQRQEVTRMHSELNREIEQASRDPGLRDRLNALRRQHDAARPKSGPLPTVQQLTPPPAAPGRPQQSSGFLRRIFG